MLHRDTNVRAMGTTTVEGAKRALELALADLAAKPTLAKLRAAKRAYSVLADIETESIYREAKATPRTERAGKRGVGSGSKVDISARQVSLDEAQQMILDAFDRLDTGRNFLPIFQLRRAVPLTPEQFVIAFNELRRRWILTADPAEGRHERVPEEVLTGGVREGTTVLAYAARR